MFLRVECGYDSDMTLTARRSIDERTIVHFADNSIEKIRAYVDSGEGLDRAGGFAAQVGVPSLIAMGLTWGIGSRWVTD